ncbi:MAG: citrate synthase family protein [Chloroflexota bacterium]
MLQKRYLTAKEAATLLEIKPATLYSYVSRGLIRSEENDNKRRTRRYLAEDVDKLKKLKEARRQPSKVAESALHWGDPVLESAISLITDGRFFYRGEDALSLARSHTVESVATLIWTGEMSSDIEASLFLAENRTLSEQCQTVFAQLGSVSPVEALQILLPLAATEDPVAYHTHPWTVARVGARILQRSATIAIGGETAGEDIVDILQQGWAPDAVWAKPLLNAALILCADHELNVSAFTARCVASAGSTPYGAVSAGLAALQGVRHGGYSSRVEALFREIEAPEKVRSSLVNRLRLGESIPGFGQQLYPDGDPRGTLLLQMIGEQSPQSPAYQLALKIADETFQLTQQHPTIDFALATLAGVLKLPPGIAITMFALGRTIGWIGHAIEQYETQQLIRPRARYVGRQPVN